MIRRVPLKRSPMPPRNTRLRPVSKKRARLNRIHGPKRKEWRESFSVCHCGCGRELTHGLDLPSDAGAHEIVGGSQREKTMQDVRLLLCVRNDCHRKLPSMPQRWQVVRQCALKFRYDNANYDLGAVNEIWMRNGAQGITQEEVDNEIRVL